MIDLKTKQNEHVTMMFMKSGEAPRLQMLADGATDYHLQGMEHTKGYLIEGHV